MARPVRHSGGWRIRWIDAAGSRRSETWPTQSQARLALAEREREKDAESFALFFEALTGGSIGPTGRRALESLVRQAAEAG